MRNGKDGQRLSSPDIAVAVTMFFPCLVYVIKNDVSTAQFPTSIGNVNFVHTNSFVCYVVRNGTENFHLVIVETMY